MQERLDGFSGIRPETIELSEMLKDAWIVAKHLDIHDALVNVDHLSLQRERIRLCRNLLAAEYIGRFRISFFHKTGFEFEGEVVCVPLGTEVILGDYRGTVVASLWAPLRSTGVEKDGHLEYVVEGSEKRKEASYYSRKDEEPEMTLNAAVRWVIESKVDVKCLLLEQYES